MKAASTSSAGPTNAYAVRVRSRCRRRAGAAKARRTAIDSANGVLPLASLLGGRLDLLHDRLGVLAAANHGLPALIHRFLNSRREQDSGRPGRLELEELRIQRVFQA